MTKHGLIVAGWSVAACVGLAAVGLLLYGVWLGIADGWQQLRDVKGPNETPWWMWVVFGAGFVILFRDNDRKVTLSYEDREALRKLAHQTERIADALSGLRRDLIETISREGEMDDYLRNDHLGDCCAGEGDSEHAERTASLPEVEG